MVNKNPVGAHYGLRGWLMQRVTAVIMLLFTLGMLGFFLTQPNIGYVEWKALFHSTLFRVLTLLFVLSLLLHAWVGVRDVLMDYLKPLWLRLTLQMGVLVFLVACAIWSVSILWGN
jgi:succinate dehydrogenase / fumarate reductase, membrane anchor subunit